MITQIPKLATTERHEGGVIIITLGSLFDGSGGFPLAGVLNGITPLWASEIEPYPIRVTETRFPSMKHLGSVLDINGAEIEPVDIITFGSPCQDLSVAGKQKGIHEGERSNLFFEAIRIAKEMREHDRTTGRSDVDLRPRFLVWENVPGAFSSNQGEDFRAVLEALGGVTEDGLSIPRPPKGKWNHAGCVVGDGWSIAWRVYDAQYWGVPQRRKRIYLVADLASERAGEILFERESVRGDSAEGGEAREGTSDHAEGGAGGSGGVKCLNPWDAQSIRQYDAGGIFPTLNANATGGLNRQGVVAAFKGGQGPKAGSIGYQEGQAPTLTSVNSGTNTVPDVVYPSVARTLTAQHDSSPCVDRGQNVLCYALKGNAIDRNTAQNGKPWSDGTSYTLDTTDRHGVCYGIDQQGGKGNANYAENVMPTLCSDSHGTPHGVCYAPNGNHCGNYEEAAVSATLQTSYHYGTGGDAAAVVYDRRGNGDGLHVPTLTGDHENRVTDYTALCVGNGQLHQMSMAKQCNTLDCMHDQQAVLMQAEHPRKYIVRRLTPLECCRLQGFPDWWEEGAQGSDSARYKMWGNGIALPCATDVLKRIKNETKEEQPCMTTRPA